MHRTAEIVPKQLMVIASFSTFLLISALFLVPISSSGKSITVSAAILSIFLQPNFRSSLLKLSKQSWFKASLALFLYAVIACFWGPALTSEKLLVLGKYSKWLVLPLLVIGFSDSKARQGGLHAFLIAMALTCAISMVKFFFTNASDPGFVFRNHIMTSFMMAFAAFLAVRLAIKSQGYKRLGYIALSTLFSVQVLFINTGRTGYIIYALMVVLLIIQQLNLRQALAAAVMSALLLSVVFFFSATMQQGLSNALSDYARYQKADKDTSIGYRLQFHGFAKDLFLKKPWFGNGTGSFTASYRIEKPVSSWTRRLLEPHSNYWLIASEFGVVGVLLFLWLISALVIASMKLPSLGPVAIALIIPFLVGSLSDSLFFYSGTGYFFVLFIGLCLGESSERTET